MKTYNLDEIIDKYVGEIGTSNRDKFEKKLKKEILKEKRELRKQKLQKINIENEN